MREHFLLDPAVAFLNHGSFGSCPRVVLEEQTRWRERLERQPVKFLVRELEGLIDETRATLGAFLGADPLDLAFVPNATTGVNTVLRSLSLAAGDELVTTDHVYPACKNALEALAARSGARVVIARVPVPVRSSGDVVTAVLGAVTARTRLVLLDHVTSPTGLVFPVERLVPELEKRGVPVLVDGAHAPGMLPLALSKLGASYYTGNLHKWTCAPKGAAFLHARRDRQDSLRALVTSHGATKKSRTRSRFHLEHDWTGTFDPSAWLCVPAALRFMGSLFPGGWGELMERNRALALRARAVLARRLEPVGPDEMIGTLSAHLLPDGPPDPENAYRETDLLQDALLEKFSIEVPIVRWPRYPARMVRISAQVYNSVEEYERLAQALETLAHV